MAQSFHANGGLNIQVDVGSGLQNLGIADDYIDVEFQIHFLEVPIDTFGGSTGTPGDIQIFPAEAIVTANLVYYDEAIFEAMTKKSMGTSTYGTNTASGTFLGANGGLFRVLLPSPIDSTPINLPSCYLANPWRYRKGTKYTQLPITLRAIPFSATPTTSSGVVTWNTTTT